MSYLRVTLASAVCFLALAAGCVGCSDRDEKAAGGSDGGYPRLARPMPYDPELARQLLVAFGLTIGEEDEFDRYPSTVSVHPYPQMGPPHYRECSGVLLAPKLALTAAHCVCTPSRGETTRFDGSGCATEAEIATHRYHRISATASEAWRRAETGKVVIHPRFQVVLDKEGGVVSSRADLAVIRLEEPTQDIPPVHLAAEEAKAGEVLSVVGFGCHLDEYGNFQGGLDDTRLFNREQVQTPIDGERFFFGSLEMADYNGDTGGPCLRETERGLELVGISQRGLGLTPTFTSTAPYREWLEEQIRLAGETP